MFKMFSFQQKLQNRQNEKQNKKVRPMHREKSNQSIETVPEEAQTLDLLDKETVLNMLKELKETK